MAYNQTRVKMHSLEWAGSIEFFNVDSACPLRALRQYRHSRFDFQHQSIGNNGG
jgi:hypothetical protein